MIDKSLMVLIINHLAAANSGLTGLVLMLQLDKRIRPNPNT